MAIAIVFVASLFLMLGVRLLQSAYRASGAEGWLGFSFLCVAVSIPLRFALHRGLFDSTSPGALAPLVPHLLMALALSAFAFFVAGVFRPDTPWARVLLAGLIGLQIATLPALVFFGAHRNDQHFANNAVSLIHALPFAWGFILSLRYHAQMKRRFALGLSDPVVTNRFALFAIWTGILVAVPILLFGLRFWASATTASGRLVSPTGELSTPGIMLIAMLVVLGSALAVSLWLSFFPPQAYLQRIKSESIPIATA